MKDKCPTRPNASPASLLLPRICQLRLLSLPAPGNEWPTLARPSAPALAVTCSRSPGWCCLGNELFREQNELRSMKSGRHANAGSRGLWKKSTGTDNVQEAQAPESCSTLGRWHGTLQRGQVTRACVYARTHLVTPRQVLPKQESKRQRRISSRGELLGDFEAHGRG